MHSCNSHFILQLTAKISENVSKDLLWRTTIWKRAWSASVQINPLQPPPFLLFLDRWLPQLGRDPKDSVKWVSWVQSINLNTPLSLSSKTKLYQGPHPALDPQKCPAVHHVRCAGLAPPPPVTTLLLLSVWHSSQRVLSPQLTILLPKGWVLIFLFKLYPRHWVALSPPNTDSLLCWEVSESSLPWEASNPKHSQQTRCQRVKESKIFMSFVVINQVVLKGQELIGSAEEPSPVAKMLEEWETWRESWGGEERMLTLWLEAELGAGSARSSGTLARCTALQKKGRACPTVRREEF